MREWLSETLMFSNGHFLLRALQADRHRRACTQSDEQIIVRPRRGIIATDIDRLVSTQLMCAADDLLEKPTCVAAHNHIGRFRPSSFNCIHNISVFFSLSGLTSWK